MEVPGSEGNKFFILLSEFIGTAMLVISINWSSTSDSTAFAVGATVFVMATIFGGISGGHFNPAVTIGMLWKEGKDRFGRNLGLTIFMIIAQGLGALFGFAIALMAFDFKKKDGVTEIPSGSNDYYVAQLCPEGGCNDKAGVGRVFCIEMICTFLFVTFVLVITKHNGSDQAPINCACIGLALYLAVRESSGVSGGCINPAVGLVQSVMQ